MTWQNSRKKELVIFLGWLLIAVLWTLVVADALPMRHHMEGPVPWFGLASSWMIAILQGRKLRRLASRPEEQTTRNAD